MRPDRLYQRFNFHPFLGLILGITVAVGAAAFAIGLIAKAILNL